METFELNSYTTKGYGQNSTHLEKQGRTENGSRYRDEKSLVKRKQ
jgi:hypothetical protein